MLSLCIDIQKLISKLYDKQTLKLEEITRINLVVSEFKYVLFLESFYCTPTSGKAGKIA